MMFRLSMASVAMFATTFLVSGCVPPEQGAGYRQPQQPAVATQTRTRQQTATPVRARAQAVRPARTVAPIEVLGSDGGGGWGG
jgi:hypothetical protein